MAKDEEYIEGIIERYGGKMPESDGRPNLREYTLLNEQMAKLIEEMRGVKTVLIKVNSKKGTSVPEPERELRPASAFQRIAKKVRLTRHAKLAARIVRTDSPPPESDG